MAQQLNKTNELDNLSIEDQKEYYQQAYLLLKTELEQVAHIVSHDLKEPSRTIQGFLNLLQVPNLTDEKKSEYTKHVQDAAQRLDKMLVDLLAHLRLENKMTSMQVCNLQDVVHQSIKELKPLAIQCNVGVRVENELPTVTSVLELLQALITHLLSNAIKFSTGKNEAEVVIRSMDAPNYYVIDIEDNGMGIDPRYEDKMFKLFSSYNSPEGLLSTGTGLAFSKKIIQLLNGKLEVKSTLGQGSTFTIMLPKKYT